MFSLRWRHPLPVPLFGLISFQEEHTGLIELNHDHPDAVEAMLEWLYSGDYPLAKSEDEKVNQALVSLLLNVRLYIIGEKYGIVDLVELAWVYATMLTDKYFVDSDEDALKLTEIITETYMDTPDRPGHKLREYMVRLAFKRVKKLLSCTQFQELLANGGDFSVDLVRLISDHVETPDPTWDSDSDCDWNSDISEDSSTQTPEGDSDLASGSAHDAEHAGLV